jgi:D-psicose/D-tagatose/L-ribulose 3-epimerase
MRFGINSVLWLTRWTDNDLWLVDKCKRMGFDAIEIPLLYVNFDATRLGKALASAGIEGVGCLAINESQDITSSDPTVRRAGIAFLTECVNKVNEWGGSSLVGAMCAAWCKNVKRPANEDEWKWSAECLREVAQHAGDVGITLCVEPINRYENYLINTLEQGASLVRMIAEPNVKILADIFHMNIEEKSFYNALIQHKGLIGHLHFSENDRGIVGTGHVDWDGVFKALSEIEFAGIGSIESFVVEVPELAAATSIWRPMAPSGDALASEGLAFLKRVASLYRLC